MLKMLTVSPVGDVKPNTFISELVANLKAQWDIFKAETIKNGKATLAQVTAFLVESLDGLIKQANDSLSGEAGPDKKATVLAAISIIYDYVIVGVLPIWLKPFASSIKQVIVFSILSFVVDWIVSKYNDGSWKAS